MATIYKRGKTYYGRVQHSGKDIRQSLETNVRSVAQKRLAEWLERLRAARWGDKPRRTFDEMMESFGEEHLPRMRPKAAARYRTSVRALIEDFEGLYLDEITTDKLAEFELRRHRGGVSDATIIRDLACLSSAFTHVQVDKGWIDTNPIQVFIRRQKRRGTLTESEPRRRYLSHEEEATILDAAGRALAAHVAFAIETGLRASEQFGISWEHVNLRKSEITVPKELAKGEKSRIVPIYPRTAQILAQSRPIRDDPERLVFCHRDGTPYTARGNTFKQLCERIGIQNIRWHDLRRTCGCRLLQDRGMSMEQVKAWLGHSSIRVTETTYAFLSVDSLKHTAHGPAQDRRTDKIKSTGKDTRNAVKSGIGSGGGPGRN